MKWTRNGRYIDTSFVHTIPRVGLDDAGAYTCSADNNLGQVGKAELTLEVLHEPIVTLPHRREVKEGERYILYTIFGQFASIFPSFHTFYSKLTNFIHIFVL